MAFKSNAQNIDSASNTHIQFNESVTKMRRNMHTAAKEEYAKYAILLFAWHQVK